LFAKVPYALAPGMGLNAFFTYTVCFGLGFTWQQALAMVFICGIINIIITVTKVRKHIIKAIPKSLQYAIGGGIGVFIAFIGFIDAGLVNFGAGVPALTNISTAGLIVTMAGLILAVVLLMFRVKGAVLLSIIGASLLAIATGVVKISDANISAAAWGEAFKALGGTFGAAFGSEGMGSLFNDISKLLILRCLKTLTICTGTASFLIWNSA
jgi:AGZA family xanthine/uracil permease-like MFS transporter